MWSLIRVNFMLFLVNSGTDARVGPIATKLWPKEMARSKIVFLLKINLNDILVNQEQKQFLIQSNSWATLYTVGKVITWKFLTDACVTLPWKLRTYDCVSSFQTGVLLWSSRMPSIDLALYLSIRPSCEELALKAIRWPSEVMPGSTTVILRGPLNPRTLVSYITPTSSWRWLERSCKVREN